VVGVLWLRSGVWRFRHSDGLGVCVYFFFSSRRRHTRLVSDWSSDVCSSDLAGITGRRSAPGTCGATTLSPGAWVPARRRRRARKIGRASCRERVESAEAAVSVKTEGTVQVVRHGVKARIEDAAYGHGAGWSV